MKRAVLLFILGALCSSPSPAKTLTIGTDNGVWTVTFDEGRYTDKQIRDLVKISPYEYIIAFVVVPQLEECNHLPCEAIYPSDPGFDSKALANLRAGKQFLGLLDSVRRELGSPDELAPVFSYVKQHLSFSLWLQQTRYDFYQSWDIDVLKRPYKGFNFMPFCGAVVSRIDNTQSEKERSTLARYQWDDCLVVAYQTYVLPFAYPTDAWRRFLKAHAIWEKFEEDTPND